MAEHRGYVTNQVLNRATGPHFSLLGHSLADLKGGATLQLSWTTNPNLWALTLFFK